MSQEADVEREAHVDCPTYGVQPMDNGRMSQEMFERLCMGLETKDQQQNGRKPFGSPTPIALIGILISLAPLSCDLLGWRGAGGNGAANNGAYFGFGGILTIVGGFLELIHCNTFSAVVFCTYGAFFFSYGATLVPAFGAVAAYEGGQASPAFQASFGFFNLWMSFVSLIYLVASIRTNIILILTFLSLFLGFALFTGGHWKAADGDMGLSNSLSEGGSACVFVTHMVLWYDFLVEILSAADFPFKLPVGDLATTRVKIRVTTKE